MCRLFKFLKPGGRLLITDYCRGEGESSEEFQSYVDNRKYDLKTVEVRMHLAVLA